MFVTNWISTTKIQKISEITNFFRHYFLSRTEVKSLLFVSNQAHTDLTDSNYFQTLQLLVLQHPLPASFHQQEGGALMVLNQSKKNEISIFLSHPGLSSKRGFLTPSLLASSLPSLSCPLRSGREDGRKDANRNQRSPSCDRTTPCQFPSIPSGEPPR